MTCGKWRACDLPEAMHAFDLFPLHACLELAQQVGNPPLIWQIHHSLGLLLEKYGNLQKANEHYAEAIALIESTASKLDDPSLTNSLLTAPQTKAIRIGKKLRVNLY